MPRLKFHTLDSPVAEDFSILFHRLHRDGWRPCIRGQPAPDVIDSQGGWIGEQPFDQMVKNEEGWVWQPTKRHPMLRVRYVGYWNGRAWSPKKVRLDPEQFGGRTGYILNFDLTQMPGLLGPQVECATWTCDGQLLYASQGSVYRYDLRSLRKGKEPVRIDLEGITKPVRKVPVAPLKSGSETPGWART